MAAIFGKKTGGLTAGTTDDDSIMGLSASDILRGKAGDDILSGGAGSDTFIFESTRAQNGFDTITDYSWTSARNGVKDILDLSAIRMTSSGGGDITRPPVGANVWLVEEESGTYLYVDRDGAGGNAAETWALLEGLHAGDPVRVHLASGPDVTLTVRQGPPVLSWSATAVTEADANDGSITDTLTITLTNGTFSGTDGQALPGAVVTNVPNGLTAVVTRTSDTTAELSFTGKAKDHVVAYDIANLTVTLGDDAFDWAVAADVIQSDLAVHFDAQDNSVVLFDLVDGWSSNHSGRAFQADTSYTIYVRVDSDSTTLNKSPGAGAPAGADWGVWKGSGQLGSDDKVILVGNDPAADISGWYADVVDTWSNGSRLNWHTTRGIYWAAVALWDFGTFFRCDAGQTKTFRCWEADAFWLPSNAGGDLSDVYQRVIPVGILTSQAALLP